MDLERCVHFIVINVNGVERGQTYRHVVYVEKNLIMLIGYKLSVHREKETLHHAGNVFYIRTHTTKATVPFRNTYTRTAVNRIDARRRR